MSDELPQEPGPHGLQVLIDRELCIGAGDCVATAPTVFGLDAQRRVVLLDPLTADEGTLWRAATRCPADAIILEDEAGEQLYP